MACSLLLILSAVVLIAKPFAGEDTVVADTSDDPYTLSFDGEDFSGEKAKQAAPKTQTVARRDDAELKYSNACASCAKNHRKAPMPAASTTAAPAEGSRTNEEVEKLAKANPSGGFAKGDEVTLDKYGLAEVPLGAPDVVKDVIMAGNKIAHFPYIWGGGHGSFQARGYDCSGSVSYALRGGGLVDRTRTSGGYMDWGEEGKGEWITIYTNPGHMFMIVGGLRFDTSFRDGPYGSRWQKAKRSMSGFLVRHPAEF